MQVKTATINQQDESEVWKGILNGNSRALTCLFNTYHPRLFKYGYRIVPKGGFIEDCIQELFLSIWERHTTLSNAKSVEAYLFISMRRTIFKNLRKQRNRENRNIKYAEDNIKLCISSEDLLIEIEYRNEHKIKLEQAINSLSKRGREVIYLKFYNGMSNSEIATVMDIKRQSVYNQVSKAIREMQQFVKYS